MPPLRLQNARPPEGGHDSRDNSLLTDSCDRLVLSANRIYQRPIHNSQPLLCASGTSGHRPLDLFIRLSLPTILSGPYSKKSYFSLAGRTSRLQVVLLAYTSYFSRTHRFFSQLFTTFRNFSFSEVSENQIFFGFFPLDEAILWGQKVGQK